MDKLILVAGATGNLGERICRQLIKRHANVRVVVRSSTDPEKIIRLKNLGVDVFLSNFDDHRALVKLCNGVTCVVSALAGLHEVMVDTQVNLLKAALAAGVSRFIPSDFCTDFTQIPEGENRNFDVRKQFQAHLDKSPIQATSIFNGAFADILRYNTPLFQLPKQTIAYYEGKADWKIDFTTMDDTAAYTAAAALDETTPRFLRIASFRVSPNDLLLLSKQYGGKPFQLVNMGSMEGLSAYNKAERAAHPAGENELYPRWQQSQYLYSMFFARHYQLDNERYDDVSWSSAAETIQPIFSSNSIKK